MEKKNIYPYYIFFNIKREYIDVNRPIKKGTNNTKDSKKYWKIYHNKINYYVNHILKLYGKCLLIDLHTNVKSNHEIQLGYGLENININSNNYKNSTIKDLAKTLNI